MTGPIIELLFRRGYQLMPKQSQPVMLCEGETNIKMVVILDYEEHRSPEKCLRSAKQFMLHLGVKSGKQVEFLCLCVIPDSYIRDEQRQLAECYSVVWFIAKDTGRLFVFENQPLEFGGIYNELEVVCKNAKKTAKKRPLVNMTIVAVNVIIFLLMQLCMSTWEWNAALKRFAMDWQAVAYQKQWYQLFTCIFLHGDASHLYSNMLILFFLGNQMECKIGSLRYAVLYFVCGILASIGSFAYHYHVLSDAVCLGASGAIYGVLGALVGALVLHRGRSKDLSVKHFLIFVGLSMLQGMFSPEIDYMAHICGFVSGFVFSGVLYNLPKKNGFLL